MASALCADGPTRTAGLRPAPRDVPAQASSVVGVLAPIVAVVFVASPISGLAMPVLPRYVHQRLGMRTFMAGVAAGVAAGVELAAALASRSWAGSYADTRGAKRAMVLGLLLGRPPACSISGL